MVIYWRRILLSWLCYVALLSLVSVLCINALVSDRVATSSRPPSLALAWTSTCRRKAGLPRLWWLWFQGASSGTIFNNPVSWVGICEACGDLSSQRLQEAEILLIVLSHSVKPVWLRTTPEHRVGVQLRIPHRSLCFASSDFVLHCATF